MLLGWGHISFTAEPVWMEEVRKNKRKKRKENESKFWRILWNSGDQILIWQQNMFCFTAPHSSSPHQTYLFIFSSFLCCRTHSLDIFSFSNNTVFLLVHRNSLLLGSQSELSKFSKLSWSPFNGYAIRHKFPSSSSSKLTDTTPEERKDTESYELLQSQTF